MKNVFLFLDAMTDRTVSFQIEYVLDIEIDSIILMAENHYSIDSFYFFKNKRTRIYNTLKECVKHCDIIIVSSSHLSQLGQIIGKEIIVVELSDIKYNNFTVPDLDYESKAVIAVLSLGEFSDQYNTEILVNKILSEKGAKIVQYFSPFTKNILDSLSHTNYLNKSLANPYNENYNVIVLAINGISSYPDLMRIMCDISPDMVLLCVNQSYRQEQELEKCLYGCAKIETIIKSPYISYGIEKEKTYPVYFGHKESASYYGSFENDLYNVLKKSILKCIYLPEDILLI